MIHHYYSMFSYQFIIIINIFKCPQNIQDIWAPSSEFVSLSIPSWQILTAHAQPFRGARDLAFCLKVPLDSLLLWASSEGSGETAQMRRLAWTFAARIGDKYQICSTRSKLHTVKQVWYEVKCFSPFTDKGEWGGVWWVCGHVANTYRFSYLTHLCLLFHERDIGKHCRPRSDAAECQSVWSGSPLFANMNFYQK